MAIHSTLLVAGLAGSVARAGSSADEVQRVLAAQGPTPGAVIACSPVDPIVRFAGQVPIPPQALPGQGGGANLRWWLDLLQPGAAREAGFDPGGSFVLSVWGDDSQRIELPFDGTEAQAEAVASHLVEPEIRILGSDFSQKDRAEWAVWRTEGTLILEKDVEGDLQSQPAMPGLVAELPDAPGCVAYIALPPDQIPEKLPIQGMGAFVPLSRDGHGFLMRVATGRPPPAALATTVGSPVTGHSTRRPLVTLVIGLDLLELMQDPALGDEAISAEDVAVVRKYVRLPPGATLAFHGKPPEGDMTLVLPVTDSRGRPVKAAKLVKAVGKVLTAQEIPFTRTSKTTFEAEFQGRRLHGHAVERGIVVGTHPGLAREAAEQAGEPWIGAEDLAYLAEWPVALVGSMPADAGMPGAGVQAGLRSREGLWEFGMRLDLPEMDAETSAMLAGLAFGAALPNFLEMQNRARRAEVPATVDGIYQAQEAYRAANGAWVALPPAPRPVDALAQEAVPWVADPAWQVLGYAPAGDLRGVYWTEVDEAGNLVVHGAADADGDGVPCHYLRRSDGQQTEQLTGPKVY